MLLIFFDLILFSFDVKADEGSSRNKLKVGADGGINNGNICRQTRPRREFRRPFLQALKYAFARPPASVRIVSSAFGILINTEVCASFLIF